MSKQQNKIKKTLKIKYVIPNHINDQYVTGVVGGVTPRNEIDMHLFHERHPIPKEFTAELDGKGGFNETAPIKGADVIRLIQGSYSMDVETAIALRGWLDKRIEFINGKVKKTKAVK